MNLLELDLYAMFFFLALFGFLFMTGVGSGLHFYFTRKRNMRAKEDKSRTAFAREEARLRRLWFPDTVSEMEVEIIAHQPRQAKS